MRAFAIVLLVIGVVLTSVGYILPDMYWATLAGPSINIVALAILAFSLFKEEPERATH